MKLFLKLLSGFLLIVNGIGAMYGGMNLMLDPNGSRLGLSTSLLIHSPFSDYQIPGIILFISNGLFSMFVFLTLLFNTKHYFFWIMLQGVVLFGWITIQIILIRYVYFLHFVLGGIAIALIINGWLLRAYQKRNVTEGSSIVSTLFVYKLKK